MGVEKGDEAQLGGIASYAFSQLREAAVPFELSGIDSARNANVATWERTPLPGGTILVYI